MNNDRVENNIQYVYSEVSHKILHLIFTNLLEVYN